MADVKWIKITTNIFSDEKIMLIEEMPEADTILVIWFKLLCMAGRDNNNGIFLMNNKIPYTEEMLATLFRRPLNTVRLAISTFEAFGMIEVVDDVIMLSNWEKHQNIDGMERIREQNRIRKRRQRERQKLMLETDSRDVSRDVTQQNKKEEEDKEEEIDKKNKRIDSQQIVDLFHSLCHSFPSVKVISDARKKAIKARLNTYSIDDFKTMFEKAEASDFLKGANDRNWTATFDWLIKDANMTKVLEGNFDNKPKRAKKEVVPEWMNKKQYQNFEGREYSMSDLEQQLLNADKATKQELSPEYQERVEALKKELGAG